ncbi:MAG: hypothetical protein PF482_01775 [Desulfobacteraceae bacterium]|jgi:hypothetical protein|nr:hypothetical protein [Desulfobacteraceae bacterium]
MFSEVLIGNILLFFGIAVIILGDKNIKSTEGSVSKLFLHKKSNLKIMKWSIGIVLIFYGLISFQTPESLYWAGLVEWILSFFCLSIIGFRNSVWFSTGKSVLSDLSDIDVKFAKWAGLLFGIGGVLFIIGMLK